MNGKSYDVKKGDIFANSKGEQHKITTSSNDPIRFLYIGYEFDEADMKYSKYRSIGEYFKNITYPCISDQYNIENSFYNLFSELKSNDIMSSEMTESIISQLIIQTYRNLTSHKKNIYSSKDAEIMNKLVYDIINYIDSNIYNVSSLSNISKDLGFSYPYMSRVFSGTAGQSLKAYFNKRRFEKSVELLKGGLSITDISEKLGYKSIHSFSRAFREYYNMSPSEYKSIILNNGNIP